MSITPRNGLTGLLGSLAVAVTGGLIASSPPEPLRSKSLEKFPLSAGAGQALPDGGELVELRRLEDPLLAVSVVPAPGAGRASVHGFCFDVGADDAEKASGGTAEALARLADDLKPVRGRPVILVIHQMMGGPGLSDSEYRLESRRAAEEALRADFEPRLRGLRPLRIGPIEQCAAYQLWESKQPGGPVIIYVFASHRWLNGVDQKRGLSNTERIAELLGGAVRRVRSTPPLVLDGGPAFNTVVLLRWSSQDLIHDHAEAEREADTGWASHRWVAMNYGSTADLPSLRGANRSRPTPGAFRPSILQPVGTRWRLGRLLGSDQRLIRAIVDELRLRRRWVSDARNAIALICEDDTPYGEQFWRAFEAAAGRSDLSEQLKLIGFTAGVDAAPRSERGRAVHKQLYAEIRGAGGQADLAGPTTPLGIAQTDYIYRDLRAFDDRLRRGGKRLAAVVLCGADAADKRPIIQLVRERFPDALIVTTDLHAFFTDPSDARVMRNLVVASHLPLDLSEYLDHTDARGEPRPSPYRSVYQGSLYLSLRYLLKAKLLNTREAVEREYGPSPIPIPHEPNFGDPNTPESWWNQIDRVPPGPFMYEIGFAGAVPLPLGGSQDGRR